MMNIATYSVHAVTIAYHTRRTHSIWCLTCLYCNNHIIVTRHKKTGLNYCSGYIKCTHSYYSIICISFDCIRFSKSAYVSCVRFCIDSSINGEIFVRLLAMFIVQKVKFKNVVKFFVQISPNFSCWVSHHHYIAS